MPIEIRELVVRANIRNDRSPQRRGERDDIHHIKEDIIRESSERFVQVLKNKDER